MHPMSRRKILAATAGLAATGTLARPYIANAQSKTANIWVQQGFVQQEDVAFKQTVADYEKDTGR